MAKSKLIHTNRPAFRRQTCLVCTKQFTSNRIDARYCSPACRKVKQRNPPFMVKKTKKKKAK